MSDNVNRPSHYNAGGVETIEGIRAALGDGFSDYCLGNVLKYVWRCKHKGKLVEDLRKAAKYLGWAIEAAEGNCPETPDSSSGKALAIPNGWRELEPDEMPLATDMHEWMGKWIARTTDSGQPYKWHDHRNIRKIETLEPEPLAIPEGWRELEENEPLSEDDLFELDGEWVGHEYDPSGGVYSSRIHRRHIRKIETLKPKPLAIPEGWRELEADEMPRVTDLYENEGVWRNRINDSSIEYARYEARHIRKIETANTSETPVSSIPDPGPGYRLLSKEPPEQVIRGDEFWQNFNREWVESENFMHEGGPQAPELYYRRKIEAAAWIPKVGDNVRVVGNHPRLCGKICVVSEVYEPPLVSVASDLVSVVSDHDGDTWWLRFDELELIEAAS